VATTSRRRVISVDVGEHRDVGAGARASRWADRRSEVDDYAKWLTVPGASVHLYGKGAPRAPAARWGM
jgi:hypothetical protein